MSTIHTIKQGEHLFRIAEENGFHDYHIVWDHPQNAELKKARENPNVLFPGDQVFIPDPELREESRSTDKNHKFQVNVETLQLRLVLEDIYEKPIADAPCDLLVEGDLHKLTSNGRGLVELQISAKAENAVLVIKSDQTPFQDVELPVKIGHLNPIDTPSGQLQRLNNLGYYRGAFGLPDPQELQSAIEEFQCEHNLTVDGVCGPLSQAKLKAVHGC